MSEWSGLESLIDALRGEGDYVNASVLERTLGIEFSAEWLEAGMGSLAVPAEYRLPAPLGGLSFRYWWDIYHDNPIDSLERLRGCRVTELGLLIVERDPVEAILRARHGDPRTLNRGLLYQRWLLEPGASGVCRLSYFDQLPDWAVEAPNTATREGYLFELARLLRSSASARAALAALGPAPEDSGLRWDADRSGQLEFVPAVAAVDLVRIFDWQNAIGESCDVHMSSWRLRVVTGSSEWGLTTETPRVGPSSVEASLVARPAGGEVPGHRPGPIGRCLLGSEDVVRMMQIR